MPSMRGILASCLVLGAVTACKQKAPADEHMDHMAAGNLSSPTVVNLPTQGDMSLPASAQHAAARLAASPRHGEWVKVAWHPGSSDSLMAWIVYPMTSNPHTPVVVVVHEIYGLSTWVRGVADQVAADGFIAIAPDLNSRTRGGPSTTELSSDSAQKLIRGVSNAEKNEGIDAVARYAMSQPSAAQRYAVIGFCWGGSTVWTHVINGGLPGFAGGVAYYGLPYMNPAPNQTTPVGDSLAKIKTPVMLLSGSVDARISAGMPGVDSAMKALGKWYYGNNYQGAIHGFMRAQDDTTAQHNHAQEQANLAAAKDAWPRTIDFLKKNLGVK